MFKLFNNKTKKEIDKKRKKLMLLPLTDLF